MSSAECEGSSVASTMDEVKVYRGEEDDEGEAPSLADDRRDVALEEEMDTKTFQPHAGGAFSSVAASMAASSPSLLPFMPAFNSPIFPLGNPLFNPATAILSNALIATAMKMSPSFAYLSPTFDAMRMMAPSSPLHAPRVPYMYPGVPLAASLRPGPLIPNQMMNYGGSPSTAASSSLRSTSNKKIKKEKEEHIKKPMNAFMWFMKENRPKLLEMEEFSQKQSAELNKELGKRWQELPKEEQQPYYDLASKDKEDHRKRYPEWSARENYGGHRKKKKKRDRTTENAETKKCRARFGMTAQEKWCKPCLRKKKCAFVTETEEEEKKLRDEEGRGSSHSAQPKASDSESDIEDDQPMLTEQQLAMVDHVKMEL